MFSVIRALTMWDESDSVLVQNVNVCSVAQGLFLCLFVCFIFKLNRSNRVWCAWRGERILRSLEEVWQTGLEGAGTAFH